MAVQRRDVVMEAMDWRTVTPAALVAVLFALEWFRGAYTPEKMPTNDRWLNTVSIVQDVLLIRPLIAFATALFLGSRFPLHADRLAALPLRRASTSSGRF